MRSVSSLELEDCLAIFTGLGGSTVVQASSANANGFAQAPLKAWFDLLQCG
jgi:hypothetical protein